MYTWNLCRTVTTEQLIKALSVAPSTAIWQVHDLGEYGETSITLENEDDWNRDWAIMFHELICEMGIDKMPEIEQARLASFWEDDEDE